MRRSAPRVFHGLAFYGPPESVVSMLKLPVDLIDVWLMQMQCG